MARRVAGPRVGLQLPMGFRRRRSCAESRGCRGRWSGRWEETGLDVRGRWTRRWVWRVGGREEWERVREAQVVEMEVLGQLLVVRAVLWSGREWWAGAGRDAAVELRREADSFASERQKRQSRVGTIPRGPLGRARANSDSCPHRHRQRSTSCGPPFARAAAAGSHPDGDKKPRLGPSARALSPPLLFPPPPPPPFFPVCGRKGLAALHVGNSPHPPAKMCDPPLDESRPSHPGLPAASPPSAALPFAYQFTAGAIAGVTELLCLYPLGQLPQCLVARCRSRVLTFPPPCAKMSCVDVRLISPRTKPLVMDSPCLSPWPGQDQDAASSWKTGGRGGALQRHGRLLQEDHRQGGVRSPRACLASKL